MRVRELMNRHVITIGESSSCREAVARMHRARVRHLPVVSSDDRLVGVVTDRDLRHLLFTPRVYKELGTVPVDLLLQALPASQVMSAPVIIVSPADDVAEAARLMLEKKIGSLPVVEGGRLVGIITETDLLRQICRVDSACSPEVADIVVCHR